MKVLARSHAADADAGDPRAAQREDAIGFLGTLGALAAVIGLFVVGGTFALAIDQRRRELALLRAIGATPRQMRWLVAGEASVLALVGGVLGCAVGLPLAGAIGRGLVDHGVAPQGFHPGPNLIALLIAGATGLFIAEVAVLTAARRAARVAPSEALLDAAVEPRSLGLGRSLLGLASLAGAGAMLALFSGESAFAFSEVTALLLAAAFVLLSPLVLAAPAAALSRPLRAGAAGLLASSAMATHRRRVGAIAGAVVLVVALAGTYAITTASHRAAVQDATALRVRAPFVLVSPSTGGLPVAAERLAARVPGVTAAVGVLPTHVFLLDRGLDNFGDPWDAAGVRADALRAPALDPGVRSGSLSGLRGMTIAISSELARKRSLGIGAILHARLADTTQTRLRVGAIYDRALGLGDVLLPLPLAAAHAPVALDNAVFVEGPATIRAGLAALTNTVPSARLLTRRQYLDGLRVADQTSTWIVWLLVGLIGAFVGIAIVNTSVMALADRRPELTLIRLIGATRRQAARMIAAEAAVTTLIGVGAGALAARLAVARIADGRPGWHIVVPPTLFGGIVAGAAALALLGSLLPAQIALRDDPSTHRSRRS
ncbi:MAG: ABC transporter permease [Solirubrobacterales bacterium]|nr:ABC transporter permease [Solirubrobacterales bacterium]